MCGDGRCVSNPDVIFSFTGQPSVACGVLQDAGLTGLIIPQFCNALPAVIGVCGCVDSVPLVGPAPRTTPAPTIPTPVRCPVIPPTGCSVCGSDDKCISNPDTILELPGQSPITCDLFQQNGLDGEFTQAFCAFLPSRIGVCGCRQLVGTDIAPTDTTTSAPTFAPTTSAPAFPIIAPTSPLLKAVSTLFSSPTESQPEEDPVEQTLHFFEHKSSGRSPRFIRGH